MLRTQGASANSAATSPRWLSPGLKLALAAGSLAALVVALVRWLAFVYEAFHSIAGRYDFSSYYAAAAALRANPRANIYDPGVLARAGEAAQVLVRPPLPYTYPPLFAIVLAPFTTLSFRVLSRLWLLGNVVLWLAITLLLAAELRRLLPRLGAVPAGAGLRSRLLALRDDPGPLLALAIAAWLCLLAAPALQTILVGQINFIVLAPLAVVPWLTRHRHERWVGVAIALAAMLKFTPVLLIGYLLLRRRWQAALAAIVALAVLALLSIAVVGPGVFFAAVPTALHVGSGDSVLGHNEALFAPLLTLSGHPAWLQAATRAATFVLAVALGFVLWRGPARSPSAAHVTTDTGDLAGYGIALCALVLVSPAAWVHHYVWVLPAAIAALGYSLAWLLTAPPARSRIRAAAPLVVAVLACWALGWGIPHAWDTEPHPAVTTYLGLPLWPLLLMLRPLGALAIACLLVWFYATPESHAKEPV